MSPETLVNEVIKQICKSLASFDLKTRNKGFKRLNQVIKLCNTGSYDLEKEHFILIWKGLHYWLWSQDKLLNQEQLIGDCCRLLPAIKKEKAKLDFIATLFQTELREWRTLDKWRTDKFMKLLRLFFRQCLEWLSETEWACLDAFIDVFKTMVSGDMADPAFSLRLQFASVFLEEVARHPMNSERWLKFVQPYFALVPGLPRHNPLLKRVEEIFFLLLPPTADDEEEEPLDIDFGDLGALLFHLGGGGGKNIKKMYEWATICFDIAGVPPPVLPPPGKKRKRELTTIGPAQPPPPPETPSPPRKRRRVSEPTAEGNGEWPAGKRRKASPAAAVMSPDGKRVSFGKIYRKPFKKKDAVKTPSPGTITSSAAGKGILKRKRFLQSKKLLIR